MPKSSNKLQNYLGFKANITKNTENQGKRWNQFLFIEFSSNFFRTSPISVNCANLRYCQKFYEKRKINETTEYSEKTLFAQNE